MRSWDRIRGADWRMLRNFLPRYSVSSKIGIQRRDTVRKTVMPNKELAKRFGVKLRYGPPDITWQKLPPAMLKLLIAIARAEQFRTPRGD